MRDLGGVLVVPLHAGLRVCNLSSSFHLHLVQYSTSVATNYIYKISSMVRFDLRPSRAPKRTRFLRIHHILFLSQFNLLSHCLVPWTPLATIITSSTNSQQRLSNEPRRNPGDVLVVPLHAGFRICTLSSSFRLHLAQYSTSVATNYIPEIPWTVRFDWVPSRVST